MVFFGTIDSFWIVLQSRRETTRTNRKNCPSSITETTGTLLDLLGHLRGIWR